MGTRTLLRVVVILAQACHITHQYFLKLAASVIRSRGEAALKQLRPGLTNENLGQNEFM